MDMINWISLTVVGIAFAVAFFIYYFSVTKPTTNPLNPRDLDLLKKYGDPRKIDPDDAPWIDSTLRLGLTIQKNGSTVCLSEKGLRLLK